MDVGTVIASVPPMDELRPEPWMLLEPDRAAGDARTARIESIGLALPSGRLTSEDLLRSTRHHPNIDIERLTGIHARHVCVEGEDSFSLAVGAARDCLARSDREPATIEMVVNCSISKNEGGLSHRFEPPLSASIKEAIGAPKAWNFDLSNACAGMTTGVFILNDFIRRGVIRCGMVVSGEYISNLSVNAAKEVRSIMSSQLASLTLGDAGVAAIVERAPEGVAGISVAGFTTVSGHSRLCVGFPSKVGPGATMLTHARAIHQAAIQEMPFLLQQTLDLAGVRFDEIDYVIPHQTSARAIRKGAKELSDRLGAAPKHVVENLLENGNTASTTHFVALHQGLSRGQFRREDKVLLIALASGLEIGVLLFTVGDLVDRYGPPS